MKIIIHKSLVDEYDFDAVLKILTSGKCPPGIAIDITENAAVIQPEGCSNILGEFGEGTEYTLIAYIDKK